MSTTGPARAERGMEGPPRGHEWRHKGASWTSPVETWTCARCGVTWIRGMGRSVPRCNRGEPMAEHDNIPKLTQDEWDSRGFRKDDIPGRYSDGAGNRYYPVEANPDLWGPKDLKGKRVGLKKIG